jgi:HAD superfamily hydrolase (TIGR01484 family)
MLPIASMPAEERARIQTIFTDIDDTLSTHGRIPSCAYDALWRAHEAGLKVIPVTGRPAGWCDHIARMWPVDLVVGENGALAYAIQAGKDGAPPALARLYADRPADADERLEVIRRQILAEVKGAKVASDQAYREYDLAIDFCEEVVALDEAQVIRIKEIFEAHGATAKISSIHVNGWFGEFDKLSMCKRAYQHFFGSALVPEQAVFLGDSPNDVPMFRFFPTSVGVANVTDFVHQMEALPSYLTTQRGGLGFAEFMDVLLAPY